MARALLLTTIYIVVLSCCNSERRPFLRYSNYLHKAHPHHWNHDQEELGRRVDAVAGGHQAAALKPRPPPLLQPLEGAPWRRWTKEALHTNTNKESRNIRKRLLEQKLKPNHPSRVIVHNNKKHKLEATLHGMPRVKRDLTETKDDFAERPGPVRAKRQVLVNPVLQPEVVMQPHMQAPLHQSQETQYQEKVDQKRDKRHIFYLINKPAAVYTGPRATVNPFIREANTDDYEIVRPEADYQGRGLGPSSDVDSYQLSETSELEYESDYTISMSDSEDWHNYPLTTPSGPNPGWGLSTLPDIYQKPKMHHYLNCQKSRTIHKIPLQILPHRLKRSPKLKKPKIGAYKEKIKQRRKLKDIRKKRRIIRNSKEDKAAKENAEEERLLENLLRKPQPKLRRTYYETEKTLGEILWSNGTHRIVEDVGAIAKQYNETHYIINKENATGDWHKQQHILFYKEQQEKLNKTIGLEQEDLNSDKIKPSRKKVKLRSKKTKDSTNKGEEVKDYNEDYDEEFTKEEEEEEERMNIMGTVSKTVKKDKSEKNKKPAAIGSHEKDMEHKAAVEKKIEDTDISKNKNNKKTNEKSIGKSKGLGKGTKTSKGSKGKGKPPKEKKGKKSPQTTNKEKEKDDRSSHKKEEKTKEELVSMGELDMSGDLGWEDQIAKRDFSDASSSEQIEIKAKKSNKKHINKKPQKKKGKR